MTTMIKMRDLPITKLAISLLPAVNMERLIQRLERQPGIVEIQRDGTTQAVLIHYMDWLKLTDRYERNL